jgi:hypothetical protein
MRLFTLTILALVLQLAGQMSSVLAVPIVGLRNTGLDGAGNYLAASAPDGNYTVIASPLGPFNPVATDDTLYPFPFWAANNPTASRWIGTSAQFSDGPNGNYLYRTTFNLPANATNVVISGLWGTDDPGFDILINGNSTGQTSAGFTSLVGFSVTSGFNVGLNTLDFLLANTGGGPTGLRVDKITGTYDVPEPASLLLAGLGMGGLFMRRRK